MVVALVPGEPGDADRFPFLPETFRCVAKKVAGVPRIYPPSPSDGLRRASTDFTDGKEGTVNGDPPQAD